MTSQGPYNSEHISSLKTFNIQSIKIICRKLTWCISPMKHTHLPYLPIGLTFPMLTLVCVQKNHQLMLHQRLLFKAFSPCTACGSTTSCSSWGSPLSCCLRARLTTTWCSGLWHSRGRCWRGGLLCHLTLISTYSYNWQGATYIAIRQ
jgi:hypothetical protein